MRFSKIAFFKNCYLFFVFFTDLFTCSFIILVVLVLRAYEKLLQENVPENYIKLFLSVFVCLRVY